MRPRPLASDQLLISTFSVACGCCVNEDPRCLLFHPSQTPQRSTCSKTSAAEQVMAKVEWLVSQELEFFIKFGLR